MNVRRFAWLLCLPLLLWMGVGCRLFRGGGKKPEPIPTPTPLPQSDFRRTPRFAPIADFERTAGWTVSSESGEVTLAKRPDKAVAGSFAAEIRFTPSGPGPHRIKLVPDTPWMVRSPFTDYAMWIRQGGKPKKAPHTIRLLGRDAGQGLRAWEWTYTPEDRWQYLHDRDTELVPWPVGMERLEWLLPDGIEGEQILWMDNLMIYQEVVGRIPQGINAVRPHGYAPAFAPVRRNSVQLDFPTSGHAFLPGVSSERRVVASEREDDRTFRFDYQDRFISLRYRVHAERGAPRITASVLGEEANEPWEWSGLELEGVDGVPEVRYAHLRDGRLWLQYTDGFSCQIQLVGQTLQIEMNSQSEQISRLKMGHLRRVGKAPPRKLTVPYLQTGSGQPWPIWSWSQGGKKWMLSCFPDWWYSMSGEYTPPGPEERGLETAMGSMRYPSRWRGGRNVFRERFYLTLGHRLEDVLPQPANPSALYRESLESLLLVEGEEETSWTSVDDHLDTKKVVPSRLLSTHPLDENWNESYLARASTGDWIPHPGDGWVRKTGRLDETTVVPDRGVEWGTPWMETEWFRFAPWRFTDMDIRMPGAGTYAQSWAELGAFSQQVAAESGAPLVGAGGAEWFWTGMAAGFEADDSHGIDTYHPILPHMSRRFILPGSALLGVGPPEKMVWPGESLEESEKVDRMLALQIAYGATGKIPYTSDYESFCRAYRILSVVHPRIGRQGVDRIAYWNGRHFLDAGEAMWEGVLDRSQIYIRLKDSTEIWVNGTRQEDWSLRVDGREMAA